MTILLTELRPGDDVSGRVHECPVCGVVFVGRRSAVYCSAACRVAAHRQREAESIPPVSD